MKNFLKMSIIAVTNYRRGVIAALFVMAVIALAKPPGNLSAQGTTFSLDGIWQTNNGHTVSISGNAAVSIQLSSGALWRNAISKGYVRVGDLIFRNIAKRAADLQWSCQELSVEFRSSAPTVATGVRWEDRTIMMSANGQSIQVGNTTYYRSGSQSAVPGTLSINGVWEAAWGHTIRVNDNTAVYEIISVLFRWQDAVYKGYIKVGDQKLRNLVRTGDLTWIGQDLDLTFDASAPDVATGVIWRNCTVTLSADGQNLTIVTFGKDYPYVVLTRKL
jgi:hypothetical protein